MNKDGPKVILASTSAHRRALLERLLEHFTAISPEVDETEIGGESPPAMAARLAELKAIAVAAKYPGAIVIGGDQVPRLGTEILRKPGSHERAVEQLRACSGKTVVFFTAVCVTGPDGRDPETWVDETTIRFRSLSHAQIDRYLRLDRPYDCAGSFKSEARGISLFEGVETEDSTALQGLPLIRLTSVLQARGVTIP